ncbi:alpha/beta fold hydrolase [Agarilytica rhodophyticola]|uniref:alpha/beta fold hydrolase n=1 Tax=Agarilytica rhodophyticola TaxID=1737490 RepID=UPI000B340F86|nr:alpha/beta fold hydrolase [Agarilytica rhodophyticola]
MKCCIQSLLVFLAFTCSVALRAACIDNVVLVHGNTGNPDDWENTVERLLNEGYSQNQIFLPDWGSKSCPSCNDHNGSEETPVRNAISSALAQSCTGEIDIIAHSMGVTLSAQQIIKLNAANKVDTFVGIAGAYRGLLSCGVYPFNVSNATCGADGLSVSSPFLDDLYDKKIADRVFSIKSWIDQIVCGTGVCLVYGVHSSRIKNENRSYTYSYGHFGLQRYTSSRQVQLIQ